MKLVKRLAPVLPAIAAVFMFSALPVCAQSYEAAMNQGSLALDRGDYNQAVTAFRNALKSEPRDFAAQHNLGVAYLALGRHADAVRELVRATSLRGDNTEAWTNLSIAYQGVGDQAKALGALDKAILADPANKVARVNRASIHGKNNRWKQAIDEYMELVKMGITDSEVLINLAKCLVSANRNDEAKKYLDETIRQDPKNVEARRELAHMYWKKEKDLNRAGEEFKRAIAAREDEPVLYEEYALVLEEQGNNKEAVKQLNRAVIYTSDNVEKERLQSKIAMLEGKTGNSQNAGSAPPPAKMQTLKREEDNRTKTRQVKTAPVKAVDVSDLLVEDNSDPMDVMPTGKKK